MAVLMVGLMPVVVEQAASLCLLYQTDTNPRMSPVDVDFEAISARTSLEVAMNTPCPGTNSFFLKRCYEIIKLMFIDPLPL